MVMNEAINQPTNRVQYIPTTTLTLPLSPFDYGIIYYYCYVTPIHTIWKYLKIMPWVATVNT
jgi:hypothetical protein